MLKLAVLLLLVNRSFAEAVCCEEKERSTSYLDIAVDLISKAKNNIPGCQGIKECPEIKAMDCADWYERGHNKSGVYKIHPINRLTSNKTLSVFCDMDTDGGGWTVIQKRGNFGRPDDYFYKDWASYKDGFGDADKDFWLGNDNIFALTNQKPSSIRFDLQDKDLNKAHAKYSDFWIDDEFHKYMLHIDGYSGNAGDSMNIHNGKNFATKDQNNVGRKENCATIYKGAWWYDPTICYGVHLNGIYNAKERGISWSGWRNSTLPSLIWTDMKIRPKTFTPLFSVYRK